MLSALTIGTDKADEYLFTHGGSLSTVHDERIIEQVARSYREAGLVLSLVSGVGGLLAAYTVFRENPSV